MLDELWNSLFDKWDDIGVAHVSLDGTIERCNRAFADVLQTDPTHLIGRNVVEITSEAGRQEARKNLETLREGRATEIKHSKEYIAADGTTVSRRLHAVCVNVKNVRLVISIVYEDTSAAEIRANEYEKKLLEIADRLSTNRVNVTMADQYQHGGTGNSMTGGISDKVVISIALAFVLIIVAVMLFVFGGVVRYDDGKRNIDVNSNGVEAQPYNKT